LLNAAWMAYAVKWILILCFYHISREGGIGGNYMNDLDKLFGVHAAFVSYYKHLLLNAAWTAYAV